MKLSTILAATAVSVAFSGAAHASAVQNVNLGTIEDGETASAGTFDLSAVDVLSVSADISGNDIGNDNDYDGSFTVGLFASNDPILKAGISLNFFGAGDVNDPVSGNAVWMGTTYDLQTTANGFQAVGFIDDIGSDPETLTVNWFNASAGTQVDATMSAVPLPAAGWMLIAGLGGLAAIRRRKQMA